jgi:hypothetical protein
VQPNNYRKQAKQTNKQTGISANHTIASSSHHKFDEATTATATVTISSMPASFRRNKG